MTTQLTVCMEGTKGAGKTTTIKELKARLEQDGWYVEVAEPFRRAHDANVAEHGKPTFVIATENREGAQMVDAQLHGYVDRAAEHFKSSFRLSGKQKGLLLYDRGWMTARRTLEDAQQAGALSEAEAELLWKKWELQIPSTIFLHTSPENTIARRDKEVLKGSGLGDEELIRADHTRRAQLAGTYGSSLICEHETQLIDDEAGRADAIQHVVEKFANAIETKAHAQRGRQS